MNILASTARWTAAIRARESERPDRLFSDPLAAVLAGDEGRAMLGPDEPFLANVADCVVIRTRFLDDFVERAMGLGVRQVVILAAGMDTRAFRLSWPQPVTAFELDRPELLKLKDQILLNEGAQPGCRRLTIGVDLETDWAARLLQAGFVSSEPSVWLAEGLFFYLDAGAVHNILNQLSSLAAPGSGLGCDFVSESFLTSPWMGEALAAMAARGMPWQSATDEPEALLAAHGWKADVKQPGEPGVYPERWRYPVMQRILRSVPRSFLTTAIKPPI